MKTTLLLILAVLPPLWLLADFWSSKTAASAKLHTSYVKVLMKSAGKREKRFPWIFPGEKIRCTILVQMKTGVLREFEVSQSEYLGIREGMTGLLTWKGNLCTRFEEF